VLAGLGNKFEIWNEEAWERNCVDWVSAESGGAELPDSLETLTL
jgi:MraZ protein